MIRGTRIGLAFCVLLLQAVTTACFAQVYAPQPFSADMSITGKNGNNMGGKWFFSPPKMRMDMTNVPQSGAGGPMGGGAIIIVDGASQTTYILMPQMHMYMESHGTSGHENPAMSRVRDLARWNNNPCAAQNHNDATCRNLGSETANGRSCDKWEVTDKSGNKSTIWIDQKLHFPIRVKGNEGSDIEFTNVKEGAQEASLFVVPPGYQPFSPGAAARQK